MKKLITDDLGGQPVYFKDFEFIQEQIRELANASLGSNDTNKVTILNGAEFTVSTDGYTINVTTEGWAYYLGEFFYIPIQSATGGTPDVAKWQIAEANDPRGEKVFKEESVGTKEVYLLRTLEVGYYPAASPGYLFEDTVIPEASPETLWVNASLQSPWYSVSSSVNYEGVKYRLDSRGYLEIVGYCICDANASETVMFILGEGFRPKKKIRVIDAGQNNSYQFFEINQNGEVRYYTDFPAFEDVYFQHRFNIEIE